MLGVLCARPRSWLLPSLSLFYAHGAAAAPFDRLGRTSSSLQPPLRDPANLSFRCAAKVGAASIWHTLLPSYWRRRRTAVHSRHVHVTVNKPGEGSWNVACDARPARWLHHPDSAWLLFGVSAGLAAVQVVESEPSLEVSVATDVLVADEPCNYRVTGVSSDGRCLFRAIAHMNCLRKGGTAPDMIHEGELADELRAQVVEELLKRRKEVEWSIDEDFDAYVKRIEQPYAWGGEPELLMASHVLRTPISVYMEEQRTRNLIKVANYGEEYGKDEENPINVLFHVYGHYDILAAIPESK